MVNEPETWRRPSACRWRQMARAVRLRFRALLEELLDQPVFERVEGYDHEAPARREHALGGGKRAGKLAQLVVDVDAQRLEGARRRVPAGDLLAPQNARNEAGKLERARERPLPAVGNDAARDGP